MTTWNELNNTRGEYQSVLIDISSFFDYYISNVSASYTSNDGFVDIEVRITHDNGVNWTDWINYTDCKHIFDGYGVKMENTKLQYRVIFDLEDNVYGKSPVFNQFLVTLLGAYKIENTGDVDCLPEIWIKKVDSSGDVNITNETTGQILKMKDLNNTETVYIDNENKDIMTDLPLKYRYSDHNKEWFKLVHGENIITGTGRFELEVRHEFKTLQG